MRPKPFGKCATLRWLGDKWGFLLEKIRPVLHSAHVYLTVIGIDVLLRRSVQSRTQIYLIQIATSVPLQILFEQGLHMSLYFLPAEYAMVVYMRTEMKVRCYIWAVLLTKFLLQPSAI